MPSFCTTCGTTLADNDRFCPACGGAVSSPTTTDPLAAQSSGSPESPRGRYADWPAPVAPGAGASSGLPTAPPLGDPGTGWSGDSAWSSPTNASWQAQADGSNQPTASFGAPLAGWWQRVGAFVLDGLIIGIPLGVLSGVLAAVYGHKVREVVGGSLVTVTHTSGAVVALSYGVSILVSALYFSILNGTGRGQTPGNRAPGIAVRDARTGAPIGFWRGLLRWFVRTLLYACFVIPGVVNDLFPLWDAKRQTLADKAARSVMVRMR
ncbi:MAG: hypothetical protein JWM85_3258 [Acidimicrobiaceae bacterium]|nr:hypothetical protein [Acidimicrobiaceae bacterium]